MGIFQFDSKFNRFMIQLLNLLLLCILFPLGSLPVVTIGVSAIAAYTVLLKIVLDGDEDVSVIATFCKAYRQNLKHGVLLSLLAGALLYSAWTSWQLFEAAPGNPMPFLIAAMAMVFAVALHLLYVLPLEARYRNSLWTALRNARLIAVQYAKHTLVLVLLLALEFALFFMVNSTLVLLGYLIGPVCFMLTVSTVAGAVFRQLEHPAPGGDE